MLVEELDEPIHVRADFAGGKIVPRLFKRGQRTYKINAVNAGWIEREGTHPTHCFSVQVGEETYFLSYHTGESSWRLTKVVLDG